MAAPVAPPGGAGADPDAAGAGAALDPAGAAAAGASAMTASPFSAGAHCPLPPGAWAGTGVAVLLPTAASLPAVSPATTGSAAAAAESLMPPHSRRGSLPPAALRPLRSDMKTRVQEWFWKIDPVNHIIGMQAVQISNFLGNIGSCVICHIPRSLVISNFLCKPNDKGQTPCLNLTKEPRE